MTWLASAGSGDPGSLASMSWMRRSDWNFHWHCKMKQATLCSSQIWNLLRSCHNWNSLSNWHLLFWQAQQAQNIMWGPTASTFLMFVINLLLNWVGIRLFGFYGVAYAQSAGRIVQFLLLVCKSPFLLSERCTLKWHSMIHLKLSAGQDWLALQSAAGFVNWAAWNLQTVYKALMMRRHSNHTLRFQSIEPQLQSSLQEGMLIPRSM